ncbi:MAG: flippase-like domain-containing protein [Muribaculaceae bacterium]|nr:flippase-like domain-containing protein [Muribaculaceae bacterium]
MAAPQRNFTLRILLPVLIGLAVVGWLFHDDFNAAVWHSLEFNSRAAIAIAAAVVFMAGRDFGLAWRFRTITDRQLSWRRAFRVDLMCAFTSAITPSAVGGSALAVFYLNREGVSVGRATTLTLTTLLLDELFFVVFCPLLFLLLPVDALFGSGQRDVFLDSVEIAFWLVYSGIVAYTLLLFCGILVWPHKVEWLVNKVFGWRPLRRWSKGAAETGANIVATSAWIRRCGRRWWLNVFGATVVSWFSRYLVVNALFWGFVPAASGLLVFGRQFVVWVLLMISPTPGGSGVSEWLFTTYYGDLIGSAGVALILAMMWRLLSYYVYLVAGILLLPSYFGKKQKPKNQ